MGQGGVCLLVVGDKGGGVWEGLCLRDIIMAWEGVSPGGAYSCFSASRAGASVLRITPLALFAL